MPVSIPAFDVPAFILPGMNDPEILRRISDKAIDFDRAHFDDGIDPAPEMMVEHHLRLATDRKLITLLQPRFAVALGFFEGYAKAVEERSERAPNVVTDELLLEAATAASNGYGIYAESMKLLGLTEKQKREVGLGEHTWGYVVLGYVAGALRKMKEPEPQNIGIVVKPPPPPPPPIAPSAPNELRTEIDDDLARAAAEYANGNATDTIEDDMRKVRYALTRPHYEHVGWYRSVVDFVEGALWELARIENAHVGDEPTMHFPPAFDRVSMPSDSRIVDLICRTIYADRNFSEREVHALDEALDDDAESLRRRIGMHSGSIAEACAVKFALLHFFSSPNQPANECSDSERAQYETTIAQQKKRIAEWFAYSQEINAALDAARSPIVREGKELTAMERIAWLKSDSDDTMEKWERSGLAYRMCIEELEREVASCKATIEATAVQAAEWRDRAERSDAIDFPAPLVFRDESERDFWDEQVHALNRRGDRSPSDVARAADEMVEERRKRMPSVATNCAAISDELLLEAVGYANEFCELKSDRTDLQNAKSAMNGNTVVELRWSNAVRSYANGAIRKARKL